MSVEQLLELLKLAVCDGDMYCLHCGCAPLEPDYDKCPVCRESNPLKDGGMI